MATITFTGSDQHVYTMAIYYPEKGLAVQCGRSSAAWGVVHVPSGSLMGTCRLGTRAQARAYQQGLLALGVDWEQGLETLAADTALREQVRTLYRQHCGHTF